MSSRILLLGPPNVGKTHYGAVLIEKWQVSNSTLKLLSSIDDLSAFSEARHYLHEGKSAPHTSGDKHKDTFFSLQTKGKTNIDLVWPDYGGEQVNLVVSTRRIPQEWCSRIKESTSWFILIRPSLVEPLTDVVNTLSSRTQHSETHAETERTWDTNVWWVELLQMLLASEGISYVNKLKQPKLVIALSCWDELKKEEQVLTPKQLLKTKLPLLHSFIESNWNEGSWTAWGISALGQSLSDNTPDETYVDRGPAESGYVVKPDGSHAPHLDLPLEWLIEG